MPRARWGVLPAVVCALVLGGCGSAHDNGTEPQMTRVQSEALVAQLERARVTATAGDLAGTRAALSGFRAQVARLRRAGAINRATAAALRTGAIRTLARATSDSAPPVQTQTTPAPAPAPKAQKKHPGKQDKKHGKGKGKGEGGD
jgi:hypothetical protein